jgi:hypothetical protein
LAQLCAPLKASVDRQATGGFMPTIALVDDDQNILTSVSIAFEADGYRIMTYMDGGSALDGQCDVSRHSNRG